MKYSEKMFDYGNGRYRFISTENLQIDDEIDLGLRKNGLVVPKIILNIEDQRQDRGKWIEPKITQIVTVNT